MRNYQEMMDCLIQLNLILGKQNYDIRYYIPSDVLCGGYEPRSFNEALMRLKQIDEFWLKKDVYCEYSVKQTQDGHVTIVITNEKIKMFKPSADKTNMFEC